MPSDYDVTALLILAGIGAAGLIVALIVAAVSLCRGVVEFLDKT